MGSCTYFPGADLIAFVIAPLNIWLLVQTLAGFGGRARLMYKGIVIIHTADGWVARNIRQWIFVSPKR